MPKATERPDASAARKDRRLRALYRRELQNNIRLSAAIVAASSSMAALLCIVGSSTVGVDFAAVTIPVTLISLAVARVVKHRGRHYVTELGIFVGVLPAIDAVAAVAIGGTVGADSTRWGCAGAARLHRLHAARTAPSHRLPGTRRTRSICCSRCRWSCPPSSLYARDPARPIGRARRPPRSERSSA